MVILGDLLEILHDVTKLEVWAYDNYRLQHEWIFGEGIKETYHQWHSRKKGELSIIDRKINLHSRLKRKEPKVWEDGWDVDKTSIPQQILNTEVTHILLSERGGCESPGGRELFVYVNMDALTAQTLKTELATVERPLEYEDAGEEVPDVEIVAAEDGDVGGCLIGP